ncbi:MAG: MFS transporter [Oscillospiraceae bacterium]|nr:MFS transporter [Oscillospiraceae bacterium]MBQ4643835.1 MFS transporter [Oscillospiraceae bacterium]
MKDIDKSNRIYFGLGTIGRDMFYSFEANTLLYFLSDVLSLPVWVFAAASMVLSVMRIFDAFNDPVTGLVIDNIKSPWGKFKPAILVGGIMSAVFSVMLFAGIGTGWAFVIIFGAAYLLWDITYGINDIGYWTLLPVLSSDQKQREKTGAFARICANIGMYIVMVAWQPVTSALGDTPEVWFWCAVVIAVIYLLGLLFPLLGIREKRVPMEKQESTSIRQMFDALLKNDQLMWTTLAMGLFMVGYCTTVNFAIYYMKYLFGNEGMYVVLVAIVGVAQLGTLSVYPMVAKRMSRRQLYTMGTVLVLIGYAIFFIAEISIILIALGAVLVFVGQAFIQTLMLMFLADTVEYGYWKLGKKNESITFSVQPLINKIGGALATGIVSLTLIISGIKVDGGTVDSIDSEGKLIIKIAMFAIPLLMIVAGYIVYLKKYKISEEFYSGILKDLEEREKIEA